MNNDHNIDGYATPSISVLGSLAELTKGQRAGKGTSGAWENNSNPR